MGRDNLYRIIFSNDWSTLHFPDSVEEAIGKAIQSYYCWFEAEPVVKEVQVCTETTWKTEYQWNNKEE